MTVTNFINNIKELPLIDINSQIEEVCGISDFFADKMEITTSSDHIIRQNREEYGDWQTNISLAERVCSLLSGSNFNPQIIIEPTCGKGSFILAALKHFDSLEVIYGIEIYKPYLLILKYAILRLYLEQPSKKIVKIHLIHDNIFDFDFLSIKRTINNRELMILGNPPWVTNSKLGEISSNNLPKKSNFKRNKGLDAITGKGNFDIAESIYLQLTKAFSTEKGSMALLIKNSVVKNILYGQKDFPCNITNIKQYKFDAQKEFGAAVAASLFLCKFDSTASQTTAVYDLYTNNLLYEYGWMQNKFVANILDYQKNIAFDSISPLKWWSGVKHDCSKVMELEKTKNGFINGLGEELDIEENCVYPLLKSSDIKGDVVENTRKYIIITQHSTSDNTNSIKTDYPKTYHYLLSHAHLLDNRGSSIYRNRPRFCLFGIGQYSFKKYKVAVSGLYKHTRFSLIMPIEGKTVMLDDTCYLLGFENLSDAKITQQILNSDSLQHFVHSLVFYDAKRIINKDLLMRINLLEVAKRIGHHELNVPVEAFNNYMKMLRNNVEPIQTSLF